GGNPICCAAGLAVLRTIAKDKLLEHTAAIGKDLAAGIEALDHPVINGVRGTGLLLGITLNQPVAKTVAAAAEKAGYLVNPIGADVIRLAPPLIIDHDQATDFLTALPSALNAAKEN